MYFVYIITIICFLNLCGAMQFGQFSNPNEFPHKVLFYMNDDIDNFCHGTIISKDWILTTARLLYETKPDGTSSIYDNIKMKAGFEVRKVDAGEFKMTIDKKDVYIHPNYDFELIDDIALVKTPQSLSFGDNVKSVVLPPYSEEKDYYVDVFVTANGVTANSDWNVTDVDDGNTLTVDYSHGIFIILKNSICQEKMTQYNPDEQITSDNLCASPKFKTDSALSSISDRDAGGAVLRYHDQVLIALAQKQLEIGIFQKIPMIFLRVVGYLDWIKEVSGVVPPARKRRGLRRDAISGYVKQKNSNESTSSNPRTTETTLKVEAAAKATLKPELVKTTLKPEITLSSTTLIPETTAIKQSTTLKPKETPNEMLVRVILRIGDRTIDVKNGDRKNISLSLNSEDTFNIDIDKQNKL